MSGSASRLPVRAHTLVLAGGLVLLAALAAYGVEVYRESATSCGALVQRGGAPDPACDGFYDDRRRLVVSLVVVGLVLLALSPLGSRTRGADAWTAADVTLPSVAARAALLSLLLPFGYLPVFLTTHGVADGGQTGATGLPEGWKAVALAGCVTLVCLVLAREGVSERAALAAAGVAVPLVLALQVALGHVLADFRIDTSARLSSPTVWLASAPLLVGVLVTAARRERQGWTAPPAAVGLSSVLLATAVVTVVLMPQLLPGLRDAEGGGLYPRNGLELGVWAPLLAALCALSLLVLTRTPPARPQ